MNVLFTLDNVSGNKFHYSYVIFIQDINKTRAQILNLDDEFSI